MSSSERIQRLKKIISDLPTAPGIYKFLNKDHQIIYVGKAKQLRNRVSSYFTDSKQHSRKTLRLVSQIHHIDFVIVNSELDALLLENSLIKEHQPKYNILLKDDKTYPFICITREPFPRVIVKRRPTKKDGKVYGPYSSVKAMNELLELFKALYKVRTCHYHLSEENIKAGKFKVCLEYHINNCKGGCEGLQSEEDYLKDIQEIEKILKGRTREIADLFKTKMQAYAEQLAFEKAQAYKDKLEKLNIFREKALVVNTSISNLIVITITSDDTQAFINILYVSEGAVTLADTFDVEKKLEEPEEDIVLLALFRFIEKYKIASSDVISNISISLSSDNYQFLQPKIGDKKKLIDLSLKNALFAKKEKLKKKEAQKSNEKHSFAVQTLKKELRLKELPMHIECFDNSNIQGTYPVAAMVCFKNGRPSKKDYRHFHIKTVVGANDFASMYEIVTRRYRRLLEEAQPLPQLIIIDGGKGQLSAACNALKDLTIYGRIAIVGIAKKLEEIYFPEDSVPLHLSKKSEGLKLIQRLRDEAHRFAITFHRNVRSKNSIQTLLHEVEGIGEKTIEKLLKHFKTIKAIKEADTSTLYQLVGKAKGDLLKSFLKQEER
ncbi:MAG: excinuclease ABC subunit UvrC [Thermonemataceae bacterium]